MRTSCLAARVQGVLSPIQQAEREDAIGDWLAGHGLDERVAAQLADTSVTIEALDAIAGEVSGPCLAATLRWAASGCSVRALASEIQDAAMRISGLVAAVKGFTHMDQGSSAEPVDLARNLANTVTVLRAKAREKTIAVASHRRTSTCRPSSASSASSIRCSRISSTTRSTQRPQGGHVEVTARGEKQRVVVRVIDNGPGIPPDVKSRIFDPFFTTKPVGKGTGIGLDLVRRLLVHNEAQIEVDSSPGRTEFRVLLPSLDRCWRTAVNKPVMLVVDDDPQVLAAVRRDLRAHYSETTPSSAPRPAKRPSTTINELKARGDALAIVLTDQRMPGTAGERRAGPRRARCTRRRSACCSRPTRTSTPPSRRSTKRTSTTT